jgi:outer membrane protein assembly factor BamB
MVSANAPSVNLDPGTGLSSSSWLAYPDTDLDLDQIRARLALLSVLNGQPERAEWELGRLRKTSPATAGTIGGRSGLLVQLIADLLAESRTWAEVPAGASWSTFSGSPERYHIGSKGFDLGGRPIWTKPLTRLTLTDAAPNSGSLRVAELDDGLLSVFPIVIRNAAIFAAGLHAEDLEAIDLHTGRLLFPRRNVPHEQVVPNLPGATSAPRMTLTAAGTTVFALTLSSHGLPSRVVALDSAAQRKLLYSIELSAPEWPGSWIFEGTPVADSRSLYAAVRNIEQIRHACHIVCFDIRSGQLRWRRQICEVETEPSIASGYVSNLLTLSEGTLYYNSNLGAVAAIRASDGMVRWLVTYPRSHNESTDGFRNQLHRFRDLTPCLLDNDIAIVAPRDSDRIFALDAISGSFLWSTPPELGADIVHLLGVANGRLIASGESLYWIDLLTGRMQGRFPGTFTAMAGHARPTPRGYGRGLLAGGQVYWPTHDAIYVFDQQTVKTDFAWQPQRLRRIELAARGATGGNLLLHDGVLLIAGADNLYAFNESGIPQHVDQRPGGRRTPRPSISRD